MVGLNRLLTWVPRVRAAEPAVFHVTHHKAGSQWILRLLEALVPERVVHPTVQSNHYLGAPVLPGKVYPTLYLTREQFESVPRPRHARRFVVIRDLRDTLVSLYFSLRFSHKILNPVMSTRRRVLSEMNQEDGLLYLMEAVLGLAAQVQWSWVAARDPIIKYEDLLENDEEILADVLLRKCRMRIDPMKLRGAVAANRFEAFSGRKAGEEDVHSHERKGVAGDWRNHFTGTVIDEFKKRYGSVLIATGYEKDFAW